jgi:hypothetical protein
MTLDEQNRKLAMIQRITSVEELDGWTDGMKTRPTFPGETAALMQRRIELQTRGAE